MGVDRSGYSHHSSTAKQQKYYLSGMYSKPKNVFENELKKTRELTQKIELKEKQLRWEKLYDEALDTMINIAPKTLNDYYKELK